LFIIFFFYKFFYDKYDRRINKEMLQKLEYQAQLQNTKNMDLANKTENEAQQNTGDLITAQLDNLDKTTSNEADAIDDLYDNNDNQTYNTRKSVKKSEYVETNNRPTAKKAIPEKITSVAQKKKNETINHQKKENNTSTTQMQKIVERDSSLMQTKVKSITLQEICAYNFTDDINAFNKKYGKARNILFYLKNNMLLDAANICNDINSSELTNDPDLLFAVALFYFETKNFNKIIELQQSITSQKNFKDNIYDFTDFFKVVVKTYHILKNDANAEIVYKKYFLK